MLYRGWERSERRQFNQTLIRGLATAFRVFVSGFFSVHTTGAGRELGRMTSDGSSRTFRAPRPTLGSS
jgi:hypothetical protein